MNISLQDISDLVRPLINDNLEPDGRYVETYENSNIFTIDEPQVQTVTSVTVNGSASGVVYTYNSSRLQITITSSLTYGDTVEIYFTYYNKYSDTEIQNKIRASLIILSARGIFDYSIIGDFIRPEMSFKERNLIAIITSILLEPNNVSISLPDVKISAPRGALTIEKMVGEILCKYKNDSTGLFSVLGGADERYKSNKIGW